MKSAVIYKPASDEWIAIEIRSVPDHYPRCCFCHDILIPTLMFTGSGCRFIGWSCSCKKLEEIKDKLELELLDFKER